MRRIHILLTVQTVVVILLSINRLSSLTTGYVASNQFLRWVDFHNMLTLPLISLVAFYLLKKQVEYDSPQHNHFWHNTLSLVFVIGVYLLAAGYGDHEVTNYLHVRFCLDDVQNDLCRIIIFNDDEFSHWVWFAGFVLMNLPLMLLQVLFPKQQSITWRDLFLLCFNAFFIGLGIFANLAFEAIGLDLYIVAAIAILASALLWFVQTQRVHMPLLIYYFTAYMLGLIATVIYKGGFS